MKILQIFPGKIWGGAEQYVLDLGIGLSERGHEVSFACYAESDVAEQLIRRNIAFKTFTSRDLRYLGSGLGLVDLMIGQELVHIHDARFLPNVIRSLGALQSRARIVMTRHSSHRKTVYRPLRRYYDRLHAIICTSRFVRDRWKEANRWCDRDLCRVVLNSIPDYRPEDADSLRLKFGIPDEDILLIFSGRIRKSKGCEVLVDALGRLNRAHWHAVFIGHDYPDGYNNLLKRIGRIAGIEERLHFYGFAEHPRDLMCQGDIGVSPSIVKEAGALINLEYMQAGVCVVTSSSGSQPEFVADGKTGFIVPPKDPETLAKVLEMLMDSPELRAATAAAGKRHYETQLSYDRFLDRIEAVYNE